MPLIPVPRLARLLLALAAATALAGCPRSPSDPPKPSTTAATSPHARTATVADDAAHGIAWRQARSEADVDAAFADAKRERKPVFLYWGAKWCPPCNQAKATLFNRQDFIERSRAFVPVYVDGDTPGAQKIGARFKVAGYPTMVLFTADATELTRLPGEVEGSRYTEVLTLGMNAQRPIKAVLADARAGAAGLTANDWRLLAFYSWDTDQQQALPEAELPSALAQLAERCPAEHADTRQRLLLKSAAAAGAERAGQAAPTPNPATRSALLAVLADPAATRSLLDVLVAQAEALARATTTAGSPERAQLRERYDAALLRAQGDTTLSRADRVSALIARVDLARLDAPKDAPPALPPALIQDVRQVSAQMDREITDGYERQAVITSVAYALTQAGLIPESDALLEANLGKSHSPYYLMSSLASNAKKRGDKEGALRWSKEAFEKSEGPATRLQLGSGYINTLVDLAPQDEAAIEATVKQLLDEAGAQPHAFYERSARSLQRVGRKVAAWNAKGTHSASLQRMQTHLGAVCAKVPAEDGQRQACEGLLRPSPAKNSTAA